MIAIRWASLAALALSLGACLSPRSAGFGIPARPLSPGAAEVGIAVGGAYQSISSAPQDNGVGGVFYNTNIGTQLPAFEANAQLGLTETVGLNLHASAAGLQPGAKFSVLTSPFELSLLPAVGAGMTTNSATTTTTAGTTTTVAQGAVDNTYDFLAGLKILLSFPFGLYAGIGYDYEYLYRYQQPSPASAITITKSNNNNICAAVGYDLKAGPFSIRPEMAAAFTAVAKNATEDGNGNRTPQPDSTVLHLFPNVVIAVATEPAPAKAAAPAP